MPVKMLDIQHPYYAEKVAYWNDIGIMYELGSRFKANAANFIRQLPREPHDAYLTWRLPRATAKPFLQSCISYYKGALFAQEPTADFAGATQGIDIEAFLSNMDGKGSNLQSFIQDLFSSDDCSGSNLALYKWAYVLIDLPQIDDDLPSLGAQKAVGALQPRLVIYHPTQVINWQDDDDGSLNWAVIKTQERESAFGQPAKVYAVWTYFGEDSFVRYRAEIKSDKPVEFASKVAEGPHALTAESECPLFRIDIGGSLDFTAATWPSILEYCDQDNLLSSALAENNRPIPVTTGGAVKVPDAGAWSRLELEDPGAKAFFLEISGNGIAATQHRLTELHEQIYTGWHRKAEGKSSHATANAQSGTSKMVDEKPSAAVLDAYGSKLKSFISMVLKWATGADSVTINGFDFKQKSTIDDSASVLAMADALRPGQPTVSEDALREAQKDLIRNAFPNLDPLRMKQMLAQVDAAPTADAIAAKRAADMVSAGLASSQTGGQDPLLGPLTRDLQGRNGA